MAFFPLGALIVDFVLTIAISVAAAASAAIAYFPSLAPQRTTIAVPLLGVVAGVTWFGHIGRSVFATMTVALVAVAVPILILGFLAPHSTGAAPPEGAGQTSMWTVLLAFPVAMELATGVEAPSSAIAQLGDRGRERFGGSRSGSPSRSRARSPSGSPRSPCGFASASREGTAP